VKMAYHLAQEARAGLSEFRIPPEFGRRLFDYQVAAVKIAAHHLNKRGGVLIGDVVGLGKTLMATALAKIFHMWTAPSLQGVLQCFDQIACVHMSGLFVRSHMNAGQDGFRDKSSKQNGDLIEGHWKMRIVSRRGSIDHTICSIILQVLASAQHGCR